MSGFDDARSAIETQLYNNITVVSTNNIEFANSRFEMPTNETWIRISIIEGNARQASLGNYTVLKRYTGSIMVDIFIPQYNGTKEGREIADEIATIFDRKQLSYGSSGTISTRITSAKDVGAHEGWYQISCTTNYQRDVN
jgi:hypothetical protein